MPAEPQQKLPDPPAPPHPLGEAMEWVARIMAVSLEMILPGLGGHWLDRRFGTHFLGVVGFGLGILGGVLHLLTMTASLKHRGRGRRGDEEDRT